MNVLPASKLPRRLDDVILADSGGADSATSDSSSDVAVADSATDSSATDASVDVAMPDSSSVCQGPPTSVDQQNLAYDGNVVVDIGEMPGQTFVAGQTGVLAGIELAICNWNGSPPTTGVQMAVYDVASGTLLATAVVPGSSIPAAGCYIGSLMSGLPPGPQYFDLSSACVHVTAGQSLSFTLTEANPSVGVCDPTTFTCTSLIPARPCSQNFPCTDDGYRVSEFGAADEYPNGHEVVNGNSFPNTDLAFKTYVR